MSAKKATMPRKLTAADHRVLEIKAGVQAKALEAIRMI